VITERPDRPQLRAVFMAAAQEVLDEYGDLIDKIEGEPHRWTSASTSRPTHAPEGPR
jgi:hypothetical protein